MSGRQEVVEMEAALQRTAAATGTDVERLRESVRLIAVTTTRSWWEALDEMSAALQPPATPMILDNLGITIRIPPTPQPDPQPNVIVALHRMYGVDPEDPDHERDRRRWEAARRTAVAMERRRQGWTLQGAMHEMQQLTLDAIEGEDR